MIPNSETDTFVVGILKNLRNISLILAGALLLLHTFIPHQHHSELDEIEHYEQHKQADNLYDLLQLAFHIDLGSDHLEAFKTVSFDYVHPYSFDYKTISASSYQLIYITSAPQDFELLQAPDLLESLKFRGPPYLV